MMLSVSAAAYRHAGRRRIHAEKRQRNRQHEKYQQRDGEHAAHTIIMADNAAIA